ncbi:malto-oligosyltrehalose trehalohydrolase [Brachybacterium sp. ACRRE]|uniref:malto-oligosyltrehalose trehalohydrolase n=1 Tax=Brachybacterium sp. ACRRE TaxID=2918184 RepID=UPI001EF3B885|nr:malto-oligosyltrehalose trehalohydrolase [Brachybacterium sp. ACRRE]MCG7309921.1 malto-oligosyltrehalose trehalohydrolase [Brachybacterium sp. ACRRE]
MSEHASDTTGTGTEAARTASSSSPARPPSGPAPLPVRDADGVLEVWAPRARTVQVRLTVPPRGEETAALPGSARTHSHAQWHTHAEADAVVRSLEPVGDGWHRLRGDGTDAEDPVAVPSTGTRYAFRLDEDGDWLPDPRSLAQPDGVHGPSEVVRPRLFPHAPWEGRSFRGGVVYELHVGTFAPSADGGTGTLDTAIERLDHLVALGVDAVELMPLAAFPGERGWGYDGVDLMAVHPAYGGPAALARFVEAAHARGLAVVLDVVLNHLGPDGNHLGAFGPYFTDRHETPWGWGVNLDDAGSDQVRAFLRGVARFWLVHMQLDGLRLDAVHELQDDSPRHFLAELADAVAHWEAETGRPLTLIAESDRNDPVTVTPTARGGLGMDMQWADDVHHAVHAWISGERQGYYVDFGSAEVLARTLTRVFEHAGTLSTFRGRVWGAPVDPSTDAYDAHSFVAFLEDHDQVGNRARGDRVHQLLSPGEHAAAITLILLGAPTPMLFQGEEWACTAPFRYFTDHAEPLGSMVTAGRREEFAQMGWDSSDVPDPQARSTFTDSSLDWEERDEGAHASMLAWYRTLIGLRRALPELTDPDLGHVGVDVLDEESLVLRRGDVHVLVSRAEGGAGMPASGTAADREVLASFGALRRDAQELVVGLAGPGALVVRRSDAAAQSAEAS